MVLKYLVIYLISINIIALIIYGIDKYKSKHALWRVPERVLLSFALLGGGIGCWLGMRLFRHKTKHTKFKILVPLYLLLWCGILGYLIYYFMQ